MRDEIPDPTTPKWRQRNGLKIEVQWDILPGAIGLRDWLLAADGAYARQWRSKPCFWLRGWVRVLGLFIGAGVFLS